METVMSNEAVAVPNPGSGNETIMTYAQTLSVGCAVRTLPHKMSSVALAVAITNLSISQCSLSDTHDRLSSRLRIGI
jgi:hypothetical protein